ncbi:GPI-anchored wall transfer protein 1 [Microdochium trichocladiopsis]|uniref:GPI-anchored wall transfer protein n=1 Tax=Microdochium trichocladiopsis TaxID=1682393 RepID=A0A9P8Y866_9PEZI|nr:GPI-anchored wall transfer protein 1 [Microdochium trichocladiopsis]KAH7034729.1 GPI-anchored wall transfer protein 1 [Microdochium trichocladiopsis]
MDTTASSAAASYKQRKEDFVSGLSGGSVAEVNYVVAVGPIAFLLWSILQSRQSFFKPYTPLSFIVDFLLNVVASLLAITLYANTTPLLSGLILVPAIFLYALPPKLPGSRKKPKLPPNASSQATTGKLGVLSTKPFLTTYRGLMMVMTCLAILAVDFKLFPRRFAKVETWGTSLMDIGVGSFVFSAGVVGARPVLKERAEGRATPLAQRLLYSMRHSFPLLVLGVIRLLSVKGLDYAEHVTEYGVHWNFFFTLGFLPPFVALFQSALKVVPSYAALALIVAVGYQVVLESTPLQPFILVGPRTDLFSKNREGICSFLGYLAIFLAGQDTGMYVLPRSITRSGSSAGSQRHTLLLTMGVWTAVWTALYFFTTDYKYGAGVQVSRRLANLPYVLWIAAFNTANLLAVCVVDTIFFPAYYNATDAKSEKEAYETATSPVLRAFNRNGLAIFLVANLLTGLVNMTVPTLDVGPVVTMAILVGYSATLTLVAVGLDVWDISIKL